MSSRLIERLTIEFTTKMNTKNIYGIINFPLSYLLGLLVFSSLCMAFCGLLCAHRTCKRPSAYMLALAFTLKEKKRLFLEVFPILVFTSYDTNDDTEQDTGQKTNDAFDSVASVARTS